MSIVANVFYVLIAIAMIVLILLQRGAGAAAGSGFGGGASATVFGARGSANFLSRSTAVLAGLFFLLSLGMGIYLGRTGTVVGAADDLGVMSGVAAPAKPDATPAPAAGSDVPAPTAPAASADTPAPTAATPDKPAPAADTPAAPATKQEGKDGK
ncbi:MAG: preprotein translocase subunit SecG [Dokdonella sp.]|uniref:preprotein translocase subunit SecG n=1 Tax=Dokdonella sp. TaxID=2291710 RepID=UPI003F802FCA